MSYRTTNKQTIQNAFKTFNLRNESYIQEGMIKMAQAGLDYLIEAHEIESHWDEGGEFDHPNQSDTTAWAIAHNGSIVRAAYYDGDKGSGIQERALSPDAMVVASKVAAQCRAGWAICITADMKGWYNEEWEKIFMNYSRDQIMQHFHDYFKPVTR